MRRWLFFGVLCAVSLASCEPQERLPAEEVLSRAARANQNLNSVRFTLDGSYSIPIQSLGGSIRGDARTKGVLLNGGGQMKISAETSASFPGSDGDMQIQAAFELFTDALETKYFKILSVETQPVNPLLTPDIIERISGRWWELPSGQTDPQEIVPTLDPKLLQAQSQVIRVTEDLGFDMLQKKKAYHYQVEVDREKLIAYLQKLSQNNAERIDESELRSKFEELTTDGELWIDAQTFALHRILWNIKFLRPQDSEETIIAFTMNLMDHNEVPSIEPLTNVALFTVEELLPKFDEFSTSSHIDLSSDLENGIIEKLLEGTLEATPSP